MPVFRQMLFSYLNFHQYLGYPKPFSGSPLPFGNILPVTHRYPFTCLPMNITGMSMSQFMCIWEATKQRQWKTSLGFCHIPAAVCLQEPHAGSPHPSPPRSSHPFLTPRPVLLLFALLFTQFCLYFCFYSPYSLTVFSIISLIFFSLISYFVFFFIRLNKSVIFFFFFN